MTLTARVWHSLRNRPGRIGHRNVMSRMHGHDAVDHSRHVAIVTSATFGFGVVLCVRDKLCRGVELIVTLETGFVCAVLVEDLAFRIAFVHRVTSETRHSFLTAALLEALR